MSRPGVRVMFDTNVLISAILNSQSTPNAAFMKASEPPYILVLCNQILDEVRRIFNLKFPKKIPDMERFLSIAHYDLVTLTSEDTVLPDEEAVRDVNDRPILRAARKAKADLFITGDKDFLDSSVKNPQIMTVAQFRQLN
jgi:putative PIN family toxin of toxin-antitoxin system